MMPSSPADRLTFIEDMEESYQQELDMWILSQECNYWMHVLLLFVVTCPHLVHITHDDSDWRY